MGIEADVQWTSKRKCEEENISICTYVYDIFCSLAVTLKGKRFIELMLINVHQKESDL